MDVRPIARAAALAAPAALFAALGATGCVSASKVTDSVRQSLHMEASRPASQAVCVWQRRLNSLQDTMNDGAQVPGIVGQLFLLTPEGKPADLTGDLTIVVYDETQRPPGVPAKVPEVWHYANPTLKNMVTTDEHFGRCCVVFIPWRMDWQDVTTVKLMGRYQNPGHPDVAITGTRVSLDFTATGTPVWTKNDDSSGGRTTTSAASFDLRGVPDGNRLAKELGAGRAPAIPTRVTGTATAQAVFQPQQPAPGEGMTPAGYPPQQPAAQPGFPQQPVPGQGMTPAGYPVPQSGAADWPQAQAAPQAPPVQQPAAFNGGQPVPAGVDIMRPPIIISRDGR
ncbi:hypothetical protein [Fimbriiglobus ruber]|uniref:Uncharacterized protein n=1 Tax=Fimbriiglobus ruber TaxID=1908690 RepID=A0A225DXI7_9BACT|nr:hypothetical protein [Fimbriiglobus ruber]OWK45673.1 hypothetical protein FRUB_02004 [Fimbriiglobus ruber]